MGRQALRADVTLSPPAQKKEKPSDRSTMPVIPCPRFHPQA